MQATDYTAAGNRVEVLAEIGAQTHVAKKILLENFDEAPPHIFVDSWTDLQASQNASFFDLEEGLAHAQTA